MQLDPRWFIQDQPTIHWKFSAPQSNLQKNGFPCKSMLFLEKKSIFLEKKSALKCLDLGNVFSCRKTQFPAEKCGFGKSRFLGRGWGQQLFNFQSPAVQWMAWTSSLNCLSCRNPYQTPDSLNCLPPFHWKPLFFTEKCFVASPSQNRLWLGGVDMAGNRRNRRRVADSRIKNAGQLS